MNFTEIWQAILLGVVEGLTEFIPVSSTGHLIYIRDIIGFKGPEGQVFEIAIQLGAILAVCWVYRQKLWNVASSLHNNNNSRHFAANIIIAFLPAVVIGVLAHDFIKEVLFSPMVVGVSLIIGGLIIFLVENMVKNFRVREIEEISYLTALKIGFLQTLAMIPGVSRSGATIMGAMSLGVDRKTATEFSFFLAIPTMFGATIYDLYKNWDSLNIEAFNLIAIGFITAFLAAMLVVRALVRYVSTHGFKPFAYYRIIAGIVILTTIYAV
ncbi:MAG: undecaprenyl-diphosphatase [Alphaproteobacteria bacterium CG11_big_fil_rev_8_21_14_0_20_44_7]|nr:MAG: undecaprenyl-diphosphatase [Alphaproteobacteria bacterium CG11_big_fil_rev_8_21_14_0_20_44_7]